MLLSVLADLVKGQLIGPDIEVNSFCIDSRTLKPNDCYIALLGENCNGHDFVDECIKLGAIAVIVSDNNDYPISSVKVDDTLKALTIIGQYQRQQFKKPVVAITGSCGKTTTRALLENICRQAGPTHASIKSFNNDIGVPVTLANLQSEHQYAILEIGTNHFGEILELTQLVKPNISMITCIAPVHIEFLQDEDGVAKEKSDIYKGMDKDGIGIIPRDSNYFDYFCQQLYPRKYITFGFHQDADIRAEYLSGSNNKLSTFNLSYQNEKVEINLQLLGKHNINNALAAAAAAVALDIPLNKIQLGLNTAQPEKQRLVTLTSKQGAVIIDDTYNANPSSVKAAIDILTSFSGQEKILILGDMGELGHQAESYHQQIGDYAKANHINQLLTCGTLSAATAKAFGENSIHFPDQIQLINFIKNKFNINHTVLVKGSRAAKMENVVAAI